MNPIRGQLVSCFTNRAERRVRKYWCVFSELWQAVILTYASVVPVCETGAILGHERGWSDRTNFIMPSLNGVFEKCNKCFWVWRKVFKWCVLVFFLRWRIITDSERELGIGKLFGFFFLCEEDVQFVLSKSQDEHKFSSMRLCFAEKSG